MYPFSLNRKRKCNDDTASEAAAELKNRQTEENGSLQMFSTRGLCAC